jgi:O-antigen/teichoic acid export membrane protein
VSGNEPQGPRTTEDAANTRAVSRRSHVLTVARGGGFLAGGSFFDFGSRFLIGLLLARLLGPADYGLYHLAISAATLFAAISSLGLDDAMVRYVAILSGRKDRPGVWGTIQIGLGLTLPLATVMGGVLYFAAPLVAEGLFDEPDLTPVLHVMAIVVPFLTLSNVLLGITRGFGRMDHAALGENVVQSVVRVVLLLILALVGLDVYLAAIVFGVADLASSITFAYFINRDFPLRPSAHTEVRRDFRGVFGFAFPLWLSGLLNNFRSNIQILLLGGLATSVSVGVFAIVAQVNTVGHAIYRAVIVAVKPLLAQLHDRGEREDLSHIYTTTTRWLLMANMPFFLGMVLYPASVLAIFGDAYTAGAAALTVMAAAELINAGTGICGSLVDMTGHTGAKLFNSVLFLVMVAVTNALLIPPLGVLGAAIAYLISITTVNLARMLEMWFLERVAPSWRAYFKPLAAGALAFGFGLGLKVLFPVGNQILPAIAQGVVVVAVFIGFLMLLGIGSDDRAIIDKTSRKLTRRFRRASV